MECQRGGAGCEVQRRTYIAFEHCPAFVESFAERVDAVSYRDGTSL